MKQLEAAAAAADDEAASAKRQLEEARRNGQGRAQFLEQQLAAARAECDQAKQDAAARAAAERRVADLEGVVRQQRSEAEELERRIQDATDARAGLEKRLAALVRAWGGRLLRIRHP